MIKTLQVVTPASVSDLTTLAQLKSTLGLDDTQDEFLERVIDVCSQAISIYLRNVGVDEEELVSLGRETVRESFYDFRVEPSIFLARRPVSSIVSVQEGGGTIISRLIGASDGAMTATSKSFTSATGPAGGVFSSSHIGKAVVVSGAGVAGADLSTTIESVVSETEVELALAASTTVSGATWTVENPGFNFLVRKQRGEISKLSGYSFSAFSSSPLVVTYQAGWLLPGQTGRNLPNAIEDACILYCRRKIDQLQEGEDFSGPLRETSVEGVGSFKFGSVSNLDRGYGLPFEVRALLDRYFEPVFA